MKLKIDSKEVNMPDFLVVGAPRSGTTSLYFYLKEHPEVFCPKIKEPQFFAFWHDKRCYFNWYKGKFIETFIIKNLDDYIKLFNDNDKKISQDYLMGEFSTIYLYKHRETLFNIKKIFKEKYNKLKIIIILRNPIERAFSQYMFFKTSGEEYLTFEEAIKPDVILSRLSNNWSPYYDYIGVSLYYYQVKSYLENFDHVKIIIYEDFIKEPEKIFKEICKFLNINENFIPKSIKRVFNSAGNFRSSIHKIIWEFLNRNTVKFFLKILIPLAIRSRLRAGLRGVIFKQSVLEKKLKENLIPIFIEDIKKLEALIHKDLSFWYAV